MEDDDLIERREALKKSTWVTVLNDNDTFTGLDGCWIAPTSDEQGEALDAGDSVEDVLPDDRRFSLNKLLMRAIDTGMFDDWLKENAPR